jgi:hypothetical protein
MNTRERLPWLRTQHQNKVRRAIKVSKLNKETDQVVQTWSSMISGPDIIRPTVNFSTVKPIPAPLPVRPNETVNIVRYQSPEFEQSRIQLDKSGKRLSKAFDTLESFLDEMVTVTDEASTFIESQQRLPVSETRELYSP